METSLRALLKRPLSATEVSVISLDVARALNYLHQKQPLPIIHRDISSANVLLGGRVTNGEPRLQFMAQPILFDIPWQLHLERQFTVHPKQSLKTKPLRLMSIVLAFFFVRCRSRKCHTLKSVNSKLHLYQTAWFELSSGDSCKPAWGETEYGGNNWWSWTASVRKLLVLFIVCM